MIKLLQKIEELFDGTLGTQKIDPVEYELKKGTELICSRLYTVPMVHEEFFKKEVERLVILGVLALANNSERGSPYFAQPKSKTNQVSFLSDFRNLNKKLNISVQEVSAYC